MYFVLGGRLVLGLLPLWGWSFRLFATHFEDSETDMLKK